MWTVVLEVEGQAPSPVASCRKLEDAQAIGLRLAEQYHGTGGKVTIAQPDSSDQLQRYSEDRWVRDQPDQPAVGEDATVYVPTLHLGERPKP